MIAESSGFFFRQFAKSQSVRDISNGLTGFPNTWIVENYFQGCGLGSHICESYYWTSTLDKLEDEEYPYSGKREYLYYRLLTDIIRRDSYTTLGQTYRYYMRDFRTGYGVRCIQN